MIRTFTSAMLTAMTFAIPLAADTTMTNEPIVVAQTQAGFERWVQGFRAKALSNGINASVFDKAFRGVKLNQRVMELDGKQSEFTKQIWEYLDTATSDTRVKNGKDKFFKHRKDLLEVEKRYQVDASAVLAIWGIESAYGSFRGDIKVVEALATLAYEGRRRKFGETQLLEALKILQNGDISAARMTGSWAGAMGHTQFIPTSYTSFAQDFNGDGRRDVWNDDNPLDALASTANYLKKHGWRFGHPWGLQVRLPSGFNYGVASTRNRKDVSTWNNLGVRLLNGKPLPNFGDAAIFVPAGATGPVFVVYKNFYVIKRYNNANSYAMAVGHLGDKIFGAPEFKGKWPRGDRSLSRSEKIEMQKLLTRRGFDTQGTDGIIGPNTISALRGFQRSMGLIPDGYASAKLLQRMR